MKPDEIIKECLWLCPATTDELCEELGLEPELLKNVLRNSELFVNPFNEADAWELSERGNQEIELQEPDII